MSERLIVAAFDSGGGRVTLRLCRRKTENHSADCAPLALTHGTLDIELDFDEMRNLNELTSKALWHRVRQFS